MSDSLGTAAGAQAPAALCGLARSCYGAAAVSLAVVDDDGLRYVAADGVGADVIVGTLLPAGQGIAGFVAASGQSVTVSEPLADPRFAREVGARTGHIPHTIQCVPYHDDDGDVAGVITIIDRTAGAALEMAQFTTLAAALTTSDGGDTAGLGERLARLPTSQRGRATAVIDSLLELLER